MSVNHRHPRQNVMRGRAPVGKHAEDLVHCSDGDCVGKDIATPAAGGPEWGETRTSGPDVKAVSNADTNAKMRGNMMPAHRPDAGQLVAAGVIRGR